MFYFQGPFRAVVRNLNNHILRHTNYRFVVDVEEQAGGPDIVLGMGVMVNVRPYSGFDGRPYAGVVGKARTHILYWKTKEIGAG